MKRKLIYTCFSICLMNGISSAGDVIVGQGTGGGTVDILSGSSSGSSGPATTTDLPEGTNLYFTTARATSAISATSPLTYSNGVIGAIAISLSTGVIGSLPTNSLSGKISLSTQVFGALPVTSLDSLISLSTGVTGLLPTNSLSGAISLSTGATGTLQAAQFPALTGDVSNSGLTVTVIDDSHAHTGSTISGLDISDDTNLTVTHPIVLTNDTLSLAPVSLSTGATGTLQAAQFPALTGDVSNSGLTITVLDDSHFHSSGTLTSVIKVTETLQTGATFYVSSGSVSGKFYLPALNCTGANGGALTTSAGGEIVCSDDDSGAGGGSGGYNVQPATVAFQLNQGVSLSTMAITTLSPGVLQVIATSSQVVSMAVSLSSQTTGILPNASLDSSSITKQGQNVIFLQSTLQSGATFFTSSGTVSGKFYASTGVFSADVNIGGYISALDNSPLIQFISTANAANSFVIQNSTSGGNPIIVSTGPDANINLGLTAQGLGGIVIVTSTTIQQSSITGGIVFNASLSSTTPGGFIVKSASDTALITTNPIFDTVGIGTTTYTVNSKLWIASKNNQTNITSYIDTVQANITASDTFIDFRSATGSEGTIAGTAGAGVLIFNTFAASHYTTVIDKSTIRPLDLLCSIGDRIDSWPSDTVVDQPVGIGPIYGLYYKSIGEVPQEGFIIITNPIKVDLAVPNVPPGAIGLTDGINTYYGFDLNISPVDIPYFPVSDQRGIQYSYQETRIVQAVRREASLKPQLFKTKICSSRADKSAVGVYGGTDNAGRDMNISMGLGQARIFNAGENIQIGDYLNSSASAGCMEKQADDIYHNYTVGKSMENVIWLPGERDRIVNVIFEGG